MKANRQPSILPGAFLPGLFPHPELLADYERILPGAADRILKMAEDQGHGRRWLEQNNLRWEYRERLLGQIFGLIVSISFLVGSIYAALNGQPVAGGIIGTGGIVGLAAVFVIGSRKRKEDRSEDVE